MKVLFLNHPESDFGGAFLYNGLCQLIGEENVFDYPYKKSYHGEVHTYSIPKIENGVTGPLPWMQPTGNPWTLFGAWGDIEDDKMLFEIAYKQLREGFFDLVVVESARDLAVRAYQQLKIRDLGMKVVVHDGEDYEDLLHDILNEMSPTLILKREFQKHWPDNHQAAGGDVIPFPFSFPYPYTRKSSEDVPYEKIRALTRISTHPDDVTAMMGRTWPMRQEVADVIRGCDEFKHNVAISPDTSEDRFQKTSLLPYFDYLKAMARSKIAVNVRGYGWDTCRYWEAPFCTVMATTDPGILIPHAFAHETTCISFNTPQECVAELRHFLKEDPAALESIRRDGRAHALKYHTNRERVRYMFERLGMNVPEPAHETEEVQLELKENDDLEKS